MEPWSSRRTVIVLLRTPQPLTGGTGSRPVARERLVVSTYSLQIHTSPPTTNSFWADVPAGEGNSRKGEAEKGTREEERERKGGEERKR